MYFVLFVVEDFGVSPYVYLCLSRCQAPEILTTNPAGAGHENPDAAEPQPKEILSTDFFLYGSIILICEIF